MKKYLMIITCFLLVISINIYGVTKESENKMIKNNFEFGLTINDMYFSVPSSLKQLIDDGWTISNKTCLLYTSPSPRDGLLSRMPSSA